MWFKETIFFNKGVLISKVFTSKWYKILGKKFVPCLCISKPGFVLSSAQSNICCLLPRSTNDSFLKLCWKFVSVTYYLPRSSSCLWQHLLLNVSSLTLFNWQDCGLTHIFGTSVNQRVITKCSPGSWAAVTQFKVFRFTVLMQWKWARANHWIPWKLAGESNTNSK